MLFTPLELNFSLRRKIIRKIYEIFFKWKVENGKLRKNFIYNLINNIPHSIYHFQKIGGLMQYKVKGVQTVSHHCFICGEENAAGMKMSFYELEKNELVGIFTGRAEHCSYSDRMHGGIITAVLDETIGRAIQVFHPPLLGYTLEINVKYRKPVPLETELYCIGRITKDTSRVFTGSGEIINCKGEILAEATGTYFKIEVANKNPELINDELFFSEKTIKRDFIELPD